jgi:hypothetical protein
MEKLCERPVSRMTGKRGMAGSNALWLTSVMLAQMMIWVGLTSSY